MPTRIIKRVWCKKCNEFELHQQAYPNPDDWFCQVCETAYTSVKLKDIPKEKIIKQRERYIESQHKDMGKFMFGMMTGTFRNRDMFAEPGSDVRIIESDAGQIQIDKRKKKIREKEYEERRIKREEEKVLLAKYKKIGRNDICICGSGLKYKKCCLSKIQKIK